MSVKIADKIIQMNNQDYVLMDASAVEYTKSDGTVVRVDEFLDNITTGGGASIDDTQASDTTTYSSNKIEGEYQNKTDDTLNTTSKKIVGAINELDKEIGIKAVKGGYEKAYRSLLETPNGKITNNNKCTSNVGQAMMYLQDTKYTLYHIENNEVLENSLQDGHTYTISFGSDNDATVEYFIFDYNDNVSNIKCLVKETVHSGAKITMPDNSYWFQVNVLNTDNITNIELVDDAFPYNDIREVVADGDVTDPNKQVKVSKVGDIAVVGEYVIYTIDESATGIYKYIDDKVGSGSGDLTDYQKKTDDTLTTIDKTVTGAINEVNGNLLDTVGFSADYKNIILNRKSGLNPYTIPITAIINNASLTELKDIDSTDIGNGKTLIYDATTGKHKYVGSAGTDELVKMDSTGDAHYLVDLLDKQTVINDNGILKVKKLDGQEVTITEINYLKGLTMNVMDLVSAFANGGVKVLNTPLNTASELDTMDRTSFIEGISYIVYVLADETHAGAKTTYLCTKTSTTFFGNADSQRNFTTNPIDLANEVTGKLGTSNIDVDNLWTLLTINDTYKTLTTNNEIFGTHGAKAMYDELTTAIGGKANATDLTTHTNNTDIHVTSAERTKWDKVTDKVDKTSITTTIDSSSTDDKVPSAKAVNIRIEEKLDKTTFNNSNLFKNGEVTGRITNANELPQGFTTAQNLTNAPVPDLWVCYLTVFHNNDLNYATQLAFVIHSSTIYIRASTHRVWGSWKQISPTTVTNVNDVPVTTITPINSLITGTIAYTVKNGICYVSLFNVRSKNNGDNFSISTTMPKPAINSSSAITRLEGSGIIGIVYINKNTTQLMANFKIAGTDGSCSFSYPVAE